MKAPTLKKIDEWISRILFFSGMDDNTLAQRKIYWIASVAVTFIISSLTIAYHLIFPELRILIYYGFFLVLVFSQGVIFPLFIRRGAGVWHMLLDQTLVALATFYCILKLGGIPYSGGLAIVGLALVFFSLNYKKKSHSIAIFVIYVVTIILAGILQPHLDVPPEMTPEVNISLFVVNLLWISGFALIFVLNFISMRVKMEQIDAKRLKELDEAKSRLYSNITHEFRTPLTVISGMAELIRNDSKRWAEEGSDKIEKNAALLLNLVNQMLDFSKLEAGGMKIQMIRSDIQLYINYLVELFRSVAELKRINLFFFPSEKEIVIDFDPEKLLIIISNLLTNAMNYTPESGKVEVRTLFQDHEIPKFEIQIEDTGRGIPEDELENIFDRYYRVKEDRAGTPPGSGLGLSITKELVILMDGAIHVESIYGIGSTFIVTLPVSYNEPILHEAEWQKLQRRYSTYVPPMERKTATKYEGDTVKEEKPMLLIVEDNLDVVEYLQALLEKEYEIKVASNGEDAIKQAREYIPDILISDVMMPVMDGIEMLDKLKRDFRTSHIPVILLTARADISSRLKGLERGADAYISKPFHKEELMTQIRMQINLRKKLRARYSSVTALSPVQDEDLKKEDDFMIKVRKIMTSNIKDEKFDIHTLCREMAMSRAQLYRKFKILTNKTVHEYLRTLRLYKAKELLTTTDISVSEAAYLTGFKNLSHFSRIFKDEFKIYPKELL